MYIARKKKSSTVINYHKTCWSGSNSDEVNESKTSEHRLGRCRKRDLGRNHREGKEMGTFGARHKDGLF